MIIKIGFIRTVILAVLGLFVFFYFAKDADDVKRENNVQRENLIQPETDRVQEEIVFREEEKTDEPKTTAEPSISLPQTAFEIQSPIEPLVTGSEKEMAENTLSAYVVDSLEEREINKKSIVAIQCLWDYTYPENVSEDPRFHAMTYFQGSGVVISKEGHILTVNHVLDSDLGKEPDPTGKSWFLKECQAAPTDNAPSPLAYNSPRFKEIEIFFQPTPEEYDYTSNSRVDFDFALLKFKETGKYDFTPLLPEIVDSESQETSMFLMGYPGAALTGMREFKILEFFSNLTKYKGLGPGANAFFYQAGSKKFTGASESFKKMQEELFASGQDSRFVKGGFSGSPLFIKGHLIGIVISSSLPYVEEQDMLLALSSYSIAEVLKKHEISL